MSRKSRLREKATHQKKGPTNVGDPNAGYGGAKKPKKVRARE